jgi:hypothetical protein
MNNRSFKQIDFLVFIVSFIVTTIGVFLKYLNFQNQIISFIVNSFGNIGGVVVGSFLFFWWIKESSIIKREVIILYVGIGLSIYELLQIIIPWQTYDVNDILGSLIGVVLASIINLLVQVWNKRSIRGIV